MPRLEWCCGVQRGRLDATAIGRAAGSCSMRQRQRLQRIAATAALQHAARGEARHTRAAACCVRGVRGREAGGTTREGCSLLTSRGGRALFRFVQPGQAGAAAPAPPAPRAREGSGSGCARPRGEEGGVRRRKAQAWRVARRGPWPVGAAAPSRPEERRGVGSGAGGTAAGVVRSAALLRVPAGHGRPARANLARGVLRCCAGGVCSAAKRGRGDGSRVMAGAVSPTDSRAIRG